MIERKLCQLFRFLNGEAALRARGIDNKDDFARGNVVRDHFVRRLEDEGKVAISRARSRCSPHGGTAVLDGASVGEQRILNFCSGDVVFQNEVFVGNYRLVTQPDSHRRGTGAVGIYFVQHRANILHGNSSIDLYRDRNVMPGAARGRVNARDRWGDAGGIRHLVGIGGPTAGLSTDGLSRDVARTNHHGEHKFVGAGFVLEHFYVGNLDFDFSARLDVGHRLGEDVRPLLIEQRGDVSLLLGLLVDLLGFLATLNDAAHDALANVQRHIVHGRVLRQRENIYRFDFVVRRIPELLSHGDARDKAADFSANVGVFQGTESG